MDVFIHKSAINLVTRNSILVPRVIRKFSLFSNGNKLTQLSFKTDPWGNIYAQKHFLDELAKKLNIRDKADWYNITTNTFRDHGGQELLRMYNNSTSKLLSTVYSEYPCSQH